MSEEPDPKKHPLWEHDQKPKNIQARGTSRPIAVEGEDELYDAIRRVRNGLFKLLLIVGLIVGGWYAYRYYFPPATPEEGEEAAIVVDRFIA